MSYKNSLDLTSDQNIVPNCAIVPNIDKQSKPTRWPKSPRIVVRRASPARARGTLRALRQVWRTLVSGLRLSLDRPQAIPKIDLPYSMEEAFELRMSNNGTMPLMPLAAPKLTGGPVYR